MCESSRLVGPEGDEHIPSALGLGGQSSVDAACSIYEKWAAMTDTILLNLFASAAKGNTEARQQIFATVYSELRRLAQRELARRGGGLTLSPTELLHEAFLDFQKRTGVQFEDRARFLGYASRAMRGLIVDHARERMALKRGGGAEITSLDHEVPAAVADDRELIQINEALEELEKLDADLAHIVDLKFFCGYTIDEIATLLNVSDRTIERQWEKARLVLYRSMRNEAGK
jgi:RNA polymerase sigma factor (TIGR02999 family)